jgi:hypothetical protein
MYVVNTQIGFTITRAKNASPTAITALRVYKPDDDIDTLNIAVNSLPTSTTTGSFTFTYTPTLVGNYRFELLSGESPYALMHMVMITVVSEDTTYITTIPV